MLVIAGLALWGTLAAFNITKESTPEIQIPVGVVTVVLPGSSPEDVERLVTDKIEARLINLSGLSKLTSSSNEGVSTVIAEFDASADITKSIQKLKDEVDKIATELPGESKTPIVSDINFVDQPIQLISISADLPPAQFARLAEDIKSELQTVPGVNRVEVSGVRDREIQVVVRKEELARLGISLAQVVSAIGAANASIPVGAITVDDIKYAIAFRGSLDRVSDIGSVPILSVAGKIVYLRDIADVRDGVQEATSYSRISVEGQPSRQAMTLSVLKVGGYDITTVTEAVKARIEQLRDTLLQGSDVVITYDAGDGVRKNLLELTTTGLETVVLVMLSLFATIGWRESVVAGLSVPLSFLIAFIGLWYTGNSFNVVSLFALILAIGILIDAGIVMVEAIHTRTRLYGDKHRAAVESLQEYAWPLIGGTMTTVAVFFPLFFISGIVGKFIAAIPFTIIFVLLASIFVALGLVPILANMFSTLNESRLNHMQDEYAERSRQWYARHLRNFLLNRRAQNRFFGAMAAGLVVSFLLPILGIMKVSFFPGDGGDFVYINIELPAGTDLNRTDLAVRTVEEKLYGDPRFSSLITTVGALNSFSSSDGSVASDPRFANITVNLVEDRDQTSSEILQDIKAELADVRIADIRVGEPSGGPPVGAPVLMKFSGNDMDALSATVSAARRALENTEGATAVDSSNKFDGTQYVLTIDRGKLATLGLSPTAVASTLRTAISGVTATKLTGGEKDVDIVVSLNLNPSYTDPHDASHTSIDSLRQIPLTTPAGQVVLLGSFIEEGVAKSSAAITHEDRLRTLSLQSDVLPGYTPGEVLASFYKKFPQENLPGGISLTVGGENEETNKSFAEMGYALIAGLALMFVILVLAFNSFRYTIYLLSIVPLSLIGVFGGLTLSLQPLSFPSLMGVIALAGVIINHAIILMDAILKRIHTGAGRELIDIVTEASVTRLRPIILTTVTTVVGMIPLTFASALFGPLALTILFGLTFSLLLTLLMIPAMVYRWPGSIVREYSIVRSASDTVSPDISSTGGASRSKR